MAKNYELNDFTDWFLPSIQELELLYQQKGVVGGFATSDSDREGWHVSYWSSTDASAEYYEGSSGVGHNAWGLLFVGNLTYAGYEAGSRFDGKKDDESIVRPIRAF